MQAAANTSQMLLMGSPRFSAIPPKQRVATTERMITLSEDTRLDISLLANRVRHSTRRAERSRPASAEAEGKRIEPGMDLRRPAAGTPRRQIDEKDPYAP